MQREQVLLISLNKSYLKFSAFNFVKNFAVHPNEPHVWSAMLGNFWLGLNADASVHVLPEQGQLNSLQSVVVSELSWKQGAPWSLTDDCSLVLLCKYRHLYYFNSGNQHRSCVCEAVNITILGFRLS